MHLTYSSAATVFIVPPKHPSDLPLANLDVRQLQQYLEEAGVPFAGDDQYDREYLAGLVVSSGLPAIKLMDQADGRWRALERNPLYLHACYDQARLSLRCAGLTVAPDGGGLRRVLARASKSPALTALDLVPGSSGGIGAEGVQELCRALKEIGDANALAAQAVQASEAAARAKTKKEKKKKKPGKGGSGKGNEPPPKEEQPPKLEQVCELEELHLGGNGIGAKGAEILPDLVSSCPTLQQLHLGGNPLGLDGAQAVASLLYRPSALTSLDLGACELGTEGAATVIKAVAEGAAGLQSLGMYYNRIGDAGALQVAAALPRRGCEDLTALDVSDNEIGDEGAVALIDALADNRSLTVLDVGRMSDAGLREALARSLFANLSLLHKHRNELEFSPSKSDLFFAAAQAAAPPAPEKKGKGKGKKKSKGKGKKGKRAKKKKR